MDGHEWDADNAAEHHDDAGWHSPAHGSSDGDAADPHPIGDHPIGDHPFGDDVAPRAHPDAADPFGDDARGGPAGGGLEHGGVAHPPLGLADDSHPLHPVDESAQLGGADDHDFGGHVDPGAAHAEAPGADAADPALEAFVGADPDAPPHADDPGWLDEPFPPPLEFADVPHPVDGYPWADPALLGGGRAVVAVEPDPGADVSVPVGELAGYDAVEVPDADPWAALVASEDPATSALARWWAPDR